MAKTRVSSGQIAGNLTFEGTTGIVVPKGTTAQRSGSALSGEIRYNTDLNVMEIYNGSAWGSMGPFPFAFTEYFIGDGTSYEFLLSNNVADANDIIVTLNGVQQRAGLDFRIIDGTILSFTEDDSTQNAPIDGTEINVRGFSPITSASIPAGSITLNELAFSDGTTGQVLTTNGSGTLSFQTIPTQDPTVGGDVSGTASNISINANTIGIAELKVSDGQLGQVLATDGSGNLSFISVSGGGGGGGGASNFFDLTGQIAYSQIPDGLIDIQKLDVTDGTLGQVLSTDGSGVLSFISVLNNLVEDTTPQLGGNLDAQTFNITGTGKIEFGANEENKISFLYANLGDLPAASSWHGMFAHVHNENAAYYAHAGNWVKLLDTNKSIDLLADVDTTSSSPTSGQSLVWNAVSAKWVPGTVAGSSQNLWLTVTGNSGTTSANTTTDTLNIVGGSDISTSVSGDTLTINYTGAGGGGGNTFANIAVSGQSTVTADSSTDTLTLVGNNGIAITTNAGTDTITIGQTAPNKFTTVNSDSGSTTANSTTDSLTVSGGTGISTAIAGDTVTITNDSPNVDQNLYATFTADTGSTTAATVTDTFAISGGTGITTAISGDQVTITNTGPTVAFSTVAVTGQTDVTADNGSDTLEFIAGSNVTLTTSGNSVTINASAGSGGTGTVTSGTSGRLAYYATTGTTVVETNSTLAWNAGTNTLTVDNLEVTTAIGDITTGNITTSGTITANTVDADFLLNSGTGTPTFTSGNDIVFDAAGEIIFNNTKLTQIGTPTTATDAVNKQYVDENTFTKFEIGADDSTLRTVLPGESIKIIGGTNVTTSSDAEGNITINAGAGSSYTDSDVDTHLNTSTAGTNEVLSWNGADYDWVAQSGGGATVISDLTDVNTSGVAAGDMLYYNGSTWVPTSGPVTQWTIGANGSSDYTFSGPGFPSGTENDPDLILYRGHTYRFNNTTGGSHPFLIKTTPGTGTGNQFTDGVSGSSTGVVIFEVPMTPTTTTLYYQCQFHAGMVGNITIV